MKLFHSTLAVFFALNTAHAMKRPIKDFDYATDLGPSPRIIGGSETDSGRYPYAVSLVDEYGNHSCGGSLIAPNIVLSAGHCAGVPAVQIGRHTLSDPSEVYETFTVAEEIVHPNYEIDWDFGSAKKDFMILKLSGQSTFEPINISPDSFDLISKAGGELTVMGWGLTSQYGWYGSDALLETDVEYVPNEICKLASGIDPYDGQQKTYEGQISDDMMCAARLGKDSCNGDSGGPLIIKGADPSLDVQVGVVSWGIGCADESFPGVYARISEEMEWIRNVACNSGPSSELCGSAAPTVSPAPTLVPTNNPTESPTTSNPTVSPTTSPAPTESKFFVTVEIGLDSFPTETSWRIESIPEGDTVYEVVSGTYYTSYESIVQTVALDHGGDYKFVISDDFGDGIINGYFKLYMGADTTDESALILGGTGSELTYEWSQIFYAGTAAPTASPAPTVSVAPTAAPTKALPYLTLEITFGGSPYEIGWSLHRAADDTEIEHRAPGAYEYWQSNAIVTETIYLPQELSDSTESLKFFFVDIAADGMQSYLGDGQEGSYKVYLGDVEDNNLLVAEDTVSGLVSEHTLVLQGSSTQPAEGSVPSVIQGNDLLAGGSLPTAVKKQTTGTDSQSSDREFQDSSVTSSGSPTFGLSFFTKAGVLIAGMAIAAN